jgi:hypothetical protein
MRRQKEVVSLLRYLSEPLLFKNKEVEGFFPLSTQKATKKLAENLYERLFSEEGTNDIQIKEEVPTENDERPVDPILKRYMQELEPKKPKLSVEAQESIDLANDFKLYEVTGKRSERLEKVYQSLLTIIATSVEAERAFSTAGYFACKIRSRMSPTTLDSLCYLRCYFNK